MKIADNEGIDNIYAAHREFTGAKIIIDLDDDVSNINEDHPDYQALKKREDMRIRMVKMADHLVVSTEEIKESVKHLNPYITVIPNAIDPEVWKVKKKKKIGRIKIGWMSSGSHLSDVSIIQPVMDEILAKYPDVEFHFAGITWDETKQGRFYHHVGTRGVGKFPQFYENLGIDISIAPLKDTHFNRCKSNIKWMEAAMLGIPTVASDVRPYHDIKHGKTGYLASSTTQWVKYLSLFIENKELRERIGQQAKQEVLDHWTIDKFLPLYENLFKKILETKDITVVTAITGGNLKDSQWKTRKACDKFVEPVMNAKIHKILTHKYINTPYIVWMDGNMTLKQDPHELVKLMGEYDFAFFKHPGRDCVYEEADACLQLGKGKIGEILEQQKEYAKIDFPEHSGLCELTAFVRKNLPDANDLFEKWWVEITRFSNRDQISFPVVFHGKEWATIPGSVADAKDFSGMKGQEKAFPGNDYFQYKLHKK